MKLQISKNPLYLTAIAIAAATIATTAQISQNIASNRAEAARSKALRVIAQHNMADSCWQIQDSEPLRIGDELSIGGTGSRTPTACFKAKYQYGFASYLNGKLQITQVFSEREVEAAKSMLKGDNK